MAHGAHHQPSRVGRWTARRAATSPGFFPRQIRWPNSSFVHCRALTEFLRNIAVPRSEQAPRCHGVVVHGPQQDPALSDHCHSTAAPHSASAVTASRHKRNQGEGPEGPACCKAPPRQAAPPRHLQAAGLEPTGHYADKEHQSRTSSVSPTTGHGPAARERHWLCFERCFAAVFQGTRDKISHFILFLFLFLPLILRSDALATPPSYQGRAGPSRRPGSQGQGDDALSFLPALPAPP